MIFERGVHLRKCLLVAIGHKERIVAKPLFAAARVQNPALANALDNLGPTAGT